jgi:anti-sigma factor RsiW
MTGRIIPILGDKHRQVLALLPWYAAGRLGEEDRAEVERHLGGCPDCQAELRLERRLIAEMGDAALLSEQPSPDPDQGWAMIRDQVAPAPAPVPKRSAIPWFGRGRAAKTPRQGGSPWLLWAFAAQSCAALGLVALVGVLAWPDAQPRYRALAAPVAPPSGNMVVIFRPETPEAELRAILNASHARVVDGPTVAGGYVLRTPDAERAEMLAGLRGRSQVVLAEPIDPVSPR